MHYIHTYIYVSPLRGLREDLLAPGLGDLAAAQAFRACALRRFWRFCLHFSICACHPCAGAMLIFSVSFQFQRMIPEGNPTILSVLSVWDVTVLTCQNFVHPAQVLWNYGFDGPEHIHITNFWNADFDGLTVASDIRNVKYIPQLLTAEDRWKLCCSTWGHELFR